MKVHVRLTFVYWKSREKFLKISRGYGKSDHHQSGFENLSRMLCIYIKKVDFTRFDFQDSIFSCMYINTTHNHIYICEWEKKTCGIIYILTQTDWPLYVHFSLTTSHFSAYSLAHKYTHIYRCAMCVWVFQLKIHKILRFSSSGPLRFSCENGEKWGVF